MPLTANLRLCGHDGDGPAPKTEGGDAKPITQVAATQVAAEFNRLSHCLCNGLRGVAMVQNGSRISMQDVNAHSALRLCFHSVT